MAQTPDAAGRIQYTVTIRGIVFKYILLVPADAAAWYGASAVQDPP
jgi:hypothetical protein